MILNPDDASSVGVALKIKHLYPGTTVEVVSMAPESVRPLIYDLVRVGVDRVNLITDKLFSGSDSYATSKVLAKYVQTYLTISYSPERMLLMVILPMYRPN